MVEEIYRLHGFAPLETPALEYSEAIGAFLPDDTTGAGGVLGLRDASGAALALRYDMTAPLARYVAENRARIVFPFRRYAIGPVWRDEKPGPGRFREFWQCDADTVGAPVGAADAEMCAMLAAILADLGLPRDACEIRVSSRRLLDGVMDAAGLAGDDADGRRLAVFRAVDKLDRLGGSGVRALLGAGRRDESGDFTPGAGLSDEQVDRILAFVECGDADPTITLARLADILGSTPAGAEGIAEIEEILTLLDSSSGSGMARIDPSIVRGLAYYTGPVFEAALTLEIRDARGQRSQFGSVAGGGRYDRLLGRFGGEDLPATGVSLGVDRLVAALMAVRAEVDAEFHGPVVVLSMLPDPAAHHRAAAELRAAGIAAEVFVGTGGMRRQMRYADRRRSPAVVIEGETEQTEEVVQIKDLRLGARLSKDIESREAWKAHPSQETVPRPELVAVLQRILARDLSEA